jgi:hypothetical protein
MKFALTAFTAALVFGVSSTAWALEVNECEKDTYPLHHALAVAAHDAADSVGGQWWKAAMPKPLEEAEKAVKAGDYERACAIVNQVEYEGRAGYVQAISQRDAGPRF